MKISNNTAIVSLALGLIISEILLEFIIYRDTKYFVNLLQSLHSDEYSNFVWNNFWKKDASMISNSQICNILRVERKDKSTGNSNNILTSESNNIINVYIDFDDDLGGVDSLFWKGEYSISDLNEDLLADSQNMNSSSNQLFQTPNIIINTSQLSSTSDIIISQSSLYQRNMSWVNDLCYDQMFGHVPRMEKILGYQGIRYLQSTYIANCKTNKQCLFESKIFPRVFDLKKECLELEQFAKTLPKTDIQSGQTYSKSFEIIEGVSKNTHSQIELNHSFSCNKFFLSKQKSKTIYAREVRDGINHYGRALLLVASVKPMIIYLSKNLQILNPQEGYTTWNQIFCKERVEKQEYKTNQESNTNINKNCQEQANNLIKNEEDLLQSLSQSLSIILKTASSEFPKDTRVFQLLLVDFELNFKHVTPLKIMQLQSFYYPSQKQHVHYSNHTSHAEEADTQQNVNIQEICNKNTSSDKILRYYSQNERIFLRDSVIVVGEMLLRKRNGIDNLIQSKNRQNISFLHLNKLLASLDFNIPLNKTLDSMIQIEFAEGKCNA